MFVVSIRDITDSHFAAVVYDARLVGSPWQDLQYACSISWPVEEAEVEDDVALVAEHATNTDRNIKLPINKSKYSLMCFMPFII